MRTYYWLLVLIGCIGVRNGFSQNGIQLGFHYSMGRSYTSIDYSQATAENLRAKAGIVVPLGLEIGWGISPHFQISSGFSILPYVVTLEHPGLFGGNNLHANFEIFQIPLQLSYRVFDPRTAKKNILFIMGASYDLLDTHTGATGSSSRSFTNGMDTGNTVWMSYGVTSNFNFSLRFGLGQEWKMGKRERLTCQLFALYSLGLRNLWGGDFYQWDQGLPDDVPLLSTYPEIMPEPTEFYDLLTSRGSYFTVGFKLMYNLKKNNPVN